MSPATRQQDLLEFYSDCYKKLWVIFAERKEPGLNPTRTEVRIWLVRALGVYGTNSTGLTGQVSQAYHEYYVLLKNLLELGISNDSRPEDFRRSVLQLLEDSTFFADIRLVQPSKVVAESLCHLLLVLQRIRTQALDFFGSSSGLGERITELIEHCFADWKAPFSPEKAVLIAVLNCWHQDLLGWEQQSGPVDLKVGLVTKVVPVSAHYETEILFVVSTSSGYEPNLRIQIGPEDTGSAAIAPAGTSDWPVTLELEKWKSGRCDARFQIKAIPDRKAVNAIIVRWKVKFLDASTGKDIGTESFHGSRLYSGGAGSIASFENHNLVEEWYSEHWSELSRAEDATAVFVVPGHRLGHRELTMAAIGKEAGDKGINVKGKINLTYPLHPLSGSLYSNGSKPGLWVIEAPAQEDDLLVLPNGEGGGQGLWRAHLKGFLEEVLPDIAVAQDALVRLGEFLWPIEESSRFSTVIQRIDQQLRSKNFWYLNCMDVNEVVRDCGQQFQDSLQDSYNSLSTLDQEILREMWMAMQERGESQIDAGRVLSSFQLESTVDVAEGLERLIAARWCRHGVSYRYGFVTLGHAKFFDTPENQKIYEARRRKAS